VLRERGAGGEAAREVFFPVSVRDHFVTYFLWCLLVGWFVLVEYEREASWEGRCERIRGFGDQRSREGTEEWEVSRREACAFDKLYSHPATLALAEPRRQRGSDVKCAADDTTAPSSEGGDSAPEDPHAVGPGHELGLRHRVLHGELLNGAQQKRPEQIVPGLVARAAASVARAGMASVQSHETITAQAVPPSLYIARHFLFL
jgi:hypothetical protein